MAIHRPAIHPRPSIHFPAALWGLLAVIGVVLLTAALLIAFPPRPISNGSTAAVQHVARFDTEAYAVVPTRANSIMGHPSGFTASYNPMRSTEIQAYPSGFTSAYNPLAPSGVGIMSYPSGITATYNPLNDPLNVMTLPELTR